MAATTQETPKPDRSALWGWLFAILAIVLGVMGGFLLEPLWRRPILIGTHPSLVMGPVFILGAAVSVVVGAIAIGRAPNNRGTAWVYLVVMLALVLIGIVPWFKDVRMRAMGATALSAAVQTRAMNEILRQEAHEHGAEFADPIPYTLERSGWIAKLEDRVDFGILKADLQRTAVSSDGHWLRIGEFVVSRDPEAFADPGSDRDIAIVGFFPYANCPIVAVSFENGVTKHFRPSDPELDATLEQSARKPPKEWMDELLGAMGGEVGEDVAEWEVM